MRAGVGLRGERVGAGRPGRVEAAGTASSRRRAGGGGRPTGEVRSGAWGDAPGPDRPHRHDAAAHGPAPWSPRFCPRCGGALAERDVEGRPRPACGACGFVWYQDPKVAACTIPEVDGRLVLVRRGIEPARGRWVFPGGYMDRGETVAEAAVRETLEETGLSVEVRGLSGVYSYRESIVVVVVYRVAVLGGVMRPGNECLEVRAFGGDEVPWEELAFPSTRDALRDYLGRGDGG